MPDKFWELLEKSVIVSGTLALGLAGAVIYLAIVGKPIPDILSQALIAVIAFFFGQRGEVAVREKASARRSAV